MPELTPSTPHIISADEFVAAAENEEFKQTAYFYKIKGKDFKQTDLYKKAEKLLKYDPDEYDPDDDEGPLDFKEFIILVNAQISSIPHPYSSERFYFIFYNCTLPGIEFHMSSGLNFLFINTYVGTIELQDATSIDSISLAENSRCEYIHMDNRSGSKDYFITDNSSLDRLMIRKNSEFNLVRIGQNSKCGDIEIIQNCAGKSIFLEGKSTCRAICVGKGCGIDYININGNSECGSVLVQEGGYTQQIYLTDESQVDLIGISGFSHSNYLTVSKAVCKRILAYDNSIIGSIAIKDNSKCGDIKISNSVFEDISISGDSQIEIINLLNNSCCGKIHISNSRVSEMTAWNVFSNLTLQNAITPLIQFNNCFIHELIWQGGTKGELYIENGTINYFRLVKTTLLKESVFSLINVNVHVVQLQELLVQGQLICRKVFPSVKLFSCISSFPTSDLANDATEFERAIYEKKLQLLGRMERTDILRVSTLKDAFDDRQTPLFRIVDSSLGKTEITGSDLTGFTVEYRDSKLLEMFFSGNKLPKEKIKIYNPTPEQELPNLEYYEQKVGIYNQLKRIFDNQGDIVEATWYHSKAMDNQERLLKEKRKQDGKKWFNEQWFDLLIFKLNKASNNHGESWRLAFRFILIISLIMYILYYTSLHYNDSFSPKAVGRFISDYFWFLDPTHKLDHHDDKPLSVFLDFVGRILIGYGIYQFIAAFRRHGRK